MNYMYLYEIKTTISIHTLPFKNPIKNKNISTNYHVIKSVETIHLLFPPHEAVSPLLSRPFGRCRDTFWGEKKKRNHWLPYKSTSHDISLTLHVRKHTVSHISFHNAWKTSTIVYYQQCIYQCAAHRTRTVVPLPSRRRVRSTVARFEATLLLRGQRAPLLRRAAATRSPPAIN